MKVYTAIGHFKGSKNITSVAIEQNTKKDFLNDCYGNEFVPYVVITEKMFGKVQNCEYETDVYEIVKKMTSNYRVWDIVSEYLWECRDIVLNKMEAAKIG